MKKKTITVRQYLRKYAMYATILSALTLGTLSCDNKVEVNQYDNIVTTLVETGVNQYKVESEVKTNDTTSIVVIKKLDNTIDTLNYDDVKDMFVNKDPLEGYKGSETPQSYYDSNMDNIWFLLYWSNYGYHLGRPYDMPIYPGVYTSKNTYYVARNTQKNVLTSRTTTRVSSTSSKAPVKSSSGYGRTSSGSRSFGG